MNTEQITNTEDLNSESGSTPKVKDPKKVKAGKALARKNAEARNLIKQDQVEEDFTSTPIDISTIYNGIQKAAVLVASGFTLYHGWKFYESYSPKGSQAFQVEPPKASTPQVEPRKSIDF